MTEDHRLRARISAERLPPGLKTLYLRSWPGDGEVFAEVVDASEEGLGLLVSCSREELGDLTLVQVEDYTGGIRLGAVIIHSAPASGDQCRVGIRFRPGRSLERYQSLLRNLL